MKHMLIMGMPKSKHYYYDCTDHKLQLASQERLIDNILMTRGNVRYGKVTYASW
jgi:hypothetical protein